jgi:hypothetical protein
VPTPTELREQSRLYRNVAEEETTPALKHRLANHALALDNLAARIEHAEATREEPAD